MIVTKAEQRRAEQEAIKQSIVGSRNDMMMDLGNDLGGFDDFYGESSSFSGNGTKATSSSSSSAVTSNGIVFREGKNKQKPTKQQKQQKQQQIMDFMDRFADEDFKSSSDDEVVGSSRTAASSSSAVTNNKRTKVTIKKKTPAATTSSSSSSAVAQSSSSSKTTSPVENASTSKSSKSSSKSSTTQKKKSDKKTTKAKTDKRKPISESENSDEDVVMEDVEAPKKTKKAKPKAVDYSTDEEAKKKMEDEMEADLTSGTLLVSQHVKNSSSESYLDSIIKHQRTRTALPPNYAYPSQSIGDDKSSRHLLYPSLFPKNTHVQNATVKSRGIANMCYQGIPFLPAQSLYCPKKNSEYDSTSKSNQLLDADSELCALQIARLDATIPELRIQRILRYVIKDNIENIEKDYQFMLALRTSEGGMDVPFTSYYKPYLRRSKCDKVMEMSSEELKEIGFLHGDLIHCPFSPVEVKVMNYLRTKNWPSKKISILLDRFADDVKHYFEDVTSGEGQHSEALTYYEKPLAIIGRKTISEVMASREKNVSDLTLSSFPTLRKMDPKFPKSSQFCTDFVYHQSWKSEMVKKSQFSDFSGSIVEIAFNKSGEKMVAASTNTEPNAYLFNLKDGKRCKLEGHTETVSDVKFTVDEQIVTSSFDKVIRVFDSDGTLVSSIKKTDTTDGHEDEVSLLAVHPEESHLLASCSEKEKSLKIWDIRNGTMLVDLLARDKRREISGIEFGKDNSLYAMTILADDNCGEVYRYDASTFQKQSTIRVQNNGIEAFSLSHCGGKIAVGGENGTVQLFNTSNCKTITNLHEQKLHNRISFVNWSADDTYIATGGYDGLVRVIDTRMNSILFTFRHNLEFVQKQGATRASWSHQPGTSLLATSGDNYATHLYSMTSGNPFITSFEERKNPVAIVAISPDDMNVCSGDDKGILYMFSLSDYDLSRN